MSLPPTPEPTDADERQPTPSFPVRHLRVLISPATMIALMSSGCAEIKVGDHFTLTLAPSIEAVDFITELNDRFADGAQLVAWPVAQGH